MLEQHKQAATVLDEICKFKIGDLVTLKTIHEAWKRDAELEDYSQSSWPSDKLHTAIPLMIIERLVQQCYGGIQVHYSLRGPTPANVTEDLKVLEFEIVPHEEIVAIQRGRFEKRMEGRKGG